MKAILRKEVQNYINANLNSDLHSLLLKKSPFPDVSMKEIVQQIKGKSVAKKKFPFLINENVIFPPQLNLEQTSSYLTAKYKADLIQSEGENFVDLTAGFGIDAFFLSEKFKNTILVEQNEDLIEIVKWNWKQLSKKADFWNGDLSSFLEESKRYFDLIFLDPARRDNHKNKVFLLEDLSPNILDLQDSMLNISSKIMIKLSPLLDISYLMKVMKDMQRIDIVAVKNEVKEILITLVSSDLQDEIIVNCVNLETNEPDFQFKWGSKESNIQFSEPLKYIYLPNNSIMKSGAFGEIAKKYSLKKLHPNTHIFTSNDFLDGFPGRILEVDIIDSKNIKKNCKYNIIAKNYPLKPDEIKKKYKLIDGGDQYLIFAESISGKIILKSI